MRVKGLLNKDSLLDVFDEDYNHIGVETCEKVHLEGLWHHNFHCWIVNPETKNVLMILLSPDHFLVPEKFDVAVFGQPTAGEKIVDGKKEIEKNFGIKIDSKDLIKIGVTKEESFVKSKNVYHRVFSHSYFFKSFMPLDQYLRNSKNISGIFEAPIGEVLSLFSDKKPSIELSGIMIDGQRVNRTVSYDDFTQRGKPYLYKILFMISSWLEIEEWEDKYQLLKE